MNKVTLYQGDVLACLAKITDESVHCVVTSPPYWGLRDYGVVGQLGLEPTMAEYVQKMVEVFSEVRRVLRKDGVCFVNLGDSYNGSGGAGGDYNKGGLKEGQPKYKGRNDTRLKPKDLCGVPWRVALALQADGWWLRSDIIWAKPNPMPESCTDRPTKSHEYIFLLTKSPKYFWDAEAVREESIGKNDHDLTGPAYFAPGQSPQTGRRVKAPDGWATHPGGHGSIHKNGREPGQPGIIRPGRNIRTVWNIATEAFPEAHFATFPQALVERCIRAGTSEKGCCPGCGAPWVRVVERKGGLVGKGWTDSNDDLGKGSSQCFRADGGERPYQVTTLGWKPGCACPPADPIPCTVLDHFLGSGTTALVAAKMGRDAIGIELKPDYAAMAKKRIKDAMGMLVDWEAPLA